MRTPRPLLVALALLLPLGTQLPTQAQTAAPAQARVIVKFKSASSLMRAQAAAGEAAAPRHAQALSARIGVSLSDGRAISAQSQVVHAAGLSSEALAARLAGDSEVEYAVPDQRRRIAVVPNDPRYPGGLTSATPAVGQWYLRPPAAGVEAAINAQGAWNLSTGAGVVVAVLDTGVRFDHPDLAVKLYPGYDFITDVPTANDGGARDSDASDPGDWITSADAAGTDFQGCTVESSSWHGTQTSGLIGAAINNGVGMAGAGADVMILPVRVLGKCGGYDSDIIAGMRWSAGLSVPGVPANTHAARVLNMSLGSEGTCSQAYADAITAVNGTGAVVVVSAGNDGLTTNSPANCAGAIAVAGVRHTGTKVGYSSLGTEVAIAAPAGNCVNTTGACLYPLLTSTNSGDTGPATNTYSDSSNISVGTSFASPLVAATAALMISADPTLTAAQVRTHLRAAARAFPTTGAGTGVNTCQAPSATPQDSECYCTTSTCGAGMLDAQAAVARVVTAAQLIPVIEYNAATVANNGSITLDATDSVIPAGRSVTYLWTVQSGTATLTSADNAATVTVQLGAAGDVVLRLTLTDDLANVETREVTLRVPATSGGGTGGGGTTPPGLISGDGGGGGALGLAWLAGLAAAVFTLQWQRRRRLRADRAR